jgi:hypothetical protein
MAFPLKNLRLSLSNVARTGNSKTLEVIGARETYKTDATGNRTDEVQNLVVDCSGYRGATLSIKFELTVKSKFDELRRLLENDAIIEIQPVGLKLNAYAMKGADGSVISGVSAKADDFSIIASDDALADDIEL